MRDRETGMVLNAVRERLEAACETRETTLRTAELDRSLSEDRVDVTLPGDPFPEGHLHLITQIRREVEDIFLGLGYEVFDDREVETVQDNFDRAQLPAVAPGALVARLVLPRRRDGAADGDLAVADPRDADAEAADLHGLDRPLSTGATRSTRPTTRPSTSSRGSPSTAGSRSPTSRAPCAR